MPDLMREQGSRRPRGPSASNQYTSNRCRKVLNAQTLLAGSDRQNQGSKIRTKTGMKSKQERLCVVRDLCPLGGSGFRVSSSELKALRPGNIYRFFIDFITTFLRVTKCHLNEFCEFLRGGGRNLARASPVAGVTCVKRP